MEENIKGIIEFINSHPEMVEQYPGLKGLIEPFQPKMTATIEKKNKVTGEVVEPKHEVELTPTSKEEMFGGGTRGFLERLLDKTNRIERFQKQPAERVKVQEKEVVMTPSSRNVDIPPVKTFQADNDKELPEEK